MGNRQKQAFALTAALLAALALAVGGEREATAASRQPPSFVVIQTDDQTLDQLYASFSPFGSAPIHAMPNTLKLIARRGITLNRYYISYPLCCPSRVSLMTGRYAHSHNVRGNVPPNGGYTGFSFRAASTHNLPVWLQQAGYRTIHVGKFLNGYGDPPFDDGGSVPPGWDAWHSIVRSDTNHFFYGYTLNSNGVLDGPYGDSGSWDTREYGVRDDFGCPFAPANGLPCYYLTDTLTNIAGGELLATPPDRPFYLQLDYNAPHGDFRRPAGPEPAPRHYDSFLGAPLPHDRSQGLNEGNVRDKPRFIRSAPRLTGSEQHTYRVYYQKMLDSLRSLDEGVKQIIDTIGGMRRLRNTYIIFTSDNGFFFGEHRLLGGKFLAYEPATHMPFLMRGPGIKPGISTGELASQIDIAPTILELAGARATKSIDGRSLVPFLRDRDLRTRRPILFESFVETTDVEPNLQRRRGNTAGASILAPPKDYAGIRLGPYKYIAWPSGEKELYNINRDPDELNNLVKIPNYFPVRNYLHNQLVTVYKDCVGRRCREPASRVPMTRKEIQRERAKRRKERRERRQRQKAAGQKG